MPSRGTSALRKRDQPNFPAIGDCDTSAPIRVVGNDPATGKRWHVGAIPRSIAGAQLDCHLGENQGVYYDDASTPLQLIVET